MGFDMNADIKMMAMPFKFWSGEEIVMETLPKICILIQGVLTIKFLVIWLNNL